MNRLNKIRVLFLAAVLIARSCGHPVQISPGDQKIHVGNSTYPFKDAPVETIDVDPYYFNHMMRIYNWKPTVVNNYNTSSPNVANVVNASLSNRTHSCRSNNVATNISTGFGVEDGRSPKPDNISTINPFNGSDVKNGPVGFRKNHRAHLDGTDNELKDDTDPYKDVPTEIIDVDPNYFNYIMNRYRWTPSKIEIVTKEPAPSTTTVQTSTDRSNFRNKLFTNRITYVLPPGQRTLPLNIHIVNGRLMPISPEVTETTTAMTTTKTTKRTLGKFWDAPQSCKDGELLVGGQCFEAFGLTLTRPK